MAWDHDYNDLLIKVLDDGEVVRGRNGTTRSVFGASVECRDLEEAIFPILTTRQIYYKGVFGELAAFVRGSQKLYEFKKFGCNYWDANAKAWVGNLGLPPELFSVGRIYGAQWRNFNGIDQLDELVRGLKSDPTSRRHVLTAYNPAEVHLGCLPPCHLLAQYSVRRGGILESCIYMRSVDLCVGLPTDMVLYAALQIALAAELNVDPGAITFMFGDAHIYENHLPMLEEQLSRDSVPGPGYEVSDDISVLNFVPEDIVLTGYEHHAPIAYTFNV